MIDILLQSITECALAEDRREALCQLRDLLIDNSQAKVALSVGALHVFIEILRHSREDVEQLRLLLECLTAVFSAHICQNAEQLAGQAMGSLGCVEMFLQLLDETATESQDFYVQFYTIGALNQLATVNCRQLQDVSIACRLQACVC